MLKINIIYVGATREKYFLAAAQEYEKRLGAYAAVNIIQIKEEKIPIKPSAAEITAAINAEGERILAVISPRAYVCALCVEGILVSSEELAAKLAGLPSTGCSEVDFIIGGSDGLADKVKQRADFKLSFSRMTFPHQLMRVILAEQLYRAFNIASGGKYHK